MYFHSFAFLSSVPPLILGYPEPAVVPTPLQLLLLLAIAGGSFGVRGSGDGRRWRRFN